MARRGDRIESFELVSRIRSGGVSSIWLGADSATGAEVTVKILHPQFTDPGDSAAALIRSRFIEEAKLLQHIDLPGVTRALRVVEDPTRALYALVMQRLEGSDLFGLIGKLGLAAVVELFARTADVLAQLHERGILHCDLKLSNIFVCYPAGADLEALDSVSVKILDFGSAERVLDGERTTDTISRRFVGTIQTLAPEMMRRLSGEEHTLGDAVDQWGLGVALYHALSGRLPFHGANVLELIENVTVKPEPPLELLPSYTSAASEGLREVVHRCLCKDPADRYPSMTALAAALRRTQAVVDAELESSDLDEPTESMEDSVIQAALQQPAATALTAPALPVLAFDPSAARTMPDRRLATLRGSDTPLILYPPVRPATPSYEPPDPSLTPIAPAYAPAQVPITHNLASALSLFWAALGVVLVGIAAYLVGWVSS